MVVEIAKGEEAVLWVNEGHPIVTKWKLLCSCAKVSQSIKVLFGVVSGVHQKFIVLDEVHSIQIQSAVLPQNILWTDRQPDRPTHGLGDRSVAKAAYA